MKMANIPHEYSHANILQGALMNFSAPMDFQVGKEILYILAKYLMVKQLVMPAATRRAGGSPACLATRYEMPPVAIFTTIQ